MLRIRKYEDIYEPIEDRNMHYIKLTDMSVSKAQKHMFCYCVQLIAVCGGAVSNACAAAAAVAVGQ
jgi:hypothetical protein